MPRMKSIAEHATGRQAVLTVRKNLAGMPETLILLSFLFAARAMSSGVSLENALARDLPRSGVLHLINPRSEHSSQLVVRLHVRQSTSFAALYLLPFKITMTMTTMTMKATAATTKTTTTTITHSHLSQNMPESTNWTQNKSPRTKAHAARAHVTSLTKCSIA